MGKRRRNGVKKKIKMCNFLFIYDHEFYIKRNPLFLTFYFVLTDERSLEGTGK